MSAVLSVRTPRHPQAAPCRAPEAAPGPARLLPPQRHRSGSDDWRQAPDLCVTAGLLSAAAAAAGAFRALREVVKLPPAVAMQPPAPPVYRRLLPASIELI
jgi:hypothetical protein